MGPFGLPAQVTLLIAEGAVHDTARLDLHAAGVAVVAGVGQKLLRAYSAMLGMLPAATWRYGRPAGLPARSPTPRRPRPMAKIRARKGRHGSHRMPPSLPEKAWFYSACVG